MPNQAKNGSVWLEDEKKSKKSYNPSEEVKNELKFVQDRLETMEKRKKELGINKKCDRMDSLFTPHLVALNGDLNTENNDYYTDFDLNEKKLLETMSTQRRKSKPLAFEKITTAVASLIKQPPQPIAKPFLAKYKPINKLVEKTYYENWKANQLVRELKKLVYHLTKYGIAYAFRHIKKDWKLIHILEGQDEKGKPKYRKERVYKTNEVIFKVINPRFVLLDDNATSPRDSNDIAIIDYLDETTFRSCYPKEVYPDAVYVKAGNQKFIELSDDGTKRIKSKKMTGDFKDKIQVVIYQNENKDLEVKVAGGVLLDSHPLPGHKLGLWGAKWVDDGDDIDGIGVGQIVEIYQSIVDDVLNSSNERLRQLVRPVRVLGNDVHISNDEDFIWESGSEMRVDGDISQIKWDRPPETSAAEIKEREMLDEEIDVATFIPKSLAGLDVSDTAYQAAQNREAALKKLSLPLDNIKDALVEDANIAFRLFRELYSEPEDTYILIPGTDEFMEAETALQQNPNDERFVRMEDGTLARRRFKMLELPLSKEMKPEGGKLIDTGNVIESNDKDFWEMIPEHFNWEGYIDIEPMSFLPVSDSLVLQEKKERAGFLMGIQDTDEMGNPILKDENGNPFRINRVQAIKDYVEATKADPDKYVVPLENPQEVAGVNNPLNATTEITPRQAMNVPQTEATNTPRL
jgi:hypothetical protein